MRSLRFFSVVLSVVSLMVLVRPVAQAAVFTFKEVLQANFAANPSLDGARLQVDMRELDALQVEAMLDSQIIASAGLSDELSPTVSPFAASGTQTTFFTGQLVKPLANGSTLTGSINYNRSELSYPSSVAPSFQASLNPIYQHHIDVTYRYPLWRGAGNLSYQSSKEAALHAIRAAQLEQHVLQEQLAAQAIGLYFQVMLNDLSLSLSEDAVARAKKLLSHQRQREQLGLIEKAERLQTAALLATRELQRVQAFGARHQGLSALNRFMYQAEGSSTQAILQAIVVPEFSLESALQGAKMKRAVFAMLDAQYAEAQAYLKQAQDADEQQLDVVAQLGTRALDGAANAALTQGLTLGDRYIGLKIEFSDTLNHSASRVAVQQSVLALENIKLERRKRLDALQSELSSIGALFVSNQAILQASKAQAQAEKEKFNAEMMRYREGRSNTATMIQFEGELRAAELRLAMAKMLLHQTSYQLVLAKGDLWLKLDWAGEKR